MSSPPDWAIPTLAPVLDGRNTYEWDRVKRRWVRKVPDGTQIPQQATPIGS